MKAPAPEAVARGGLRQGLVGAAACGLSLLALAVALWVVSAKGLPGTLNEQEIGRYQYGISAVLTQERFGIGGFVFSTALYQALAKAGMSDEPRDLQPLGLKAPDNLRDAALLQHAIDTAAATAIAPPANRPEGGHYRDLVDFTYQDLGLTTLLRLSFALFGRNLPGVTYTYFLILGASALLYTAAYRRRPAAMAALPLLTLALCVICTNPLINFPLLDVKDPRFFSTIAAIPVLHFLVMLASPRRSLKLADYVLLIAQSALFAFAMHIRSSIMWAVIGLGLLLVLFTARALWAAPREWPALLDWRRSRSLPAFAAVFGTLALAQLAVGLTVHPMYRLEGDLTRHHLWFGIYYSLAINPEWETKYLASVNGAEADAMPAEVVRQAIAKLPPDKQQKYMNNYYHAPARDREEILVRQLFFDFFRHDPGFVLRTFFVVKPVRIVTTALHFHKSTIAANPAWEAAVLPTEDGFDLAQLPHVPSLTFAWRAVILLAALLTIAAIAAADAEAVGFLWRLGGMLVFLAVVAWLPNWLVALNPLVMIDNFLWTMMAAGLLLTLGGVVAIRGLRRAMLPSEVAGKPSSTA